MADPATVHGLPDEVALHTPGLFCDCPAGQAQLAMRRRRVEGWNRFLEETEAARRAAAAKRHSWAGVPAKFQGVTLNGLMAKALVEVDGRKVIEPAKAEAIKAAKAYLDQGQVINRNGTRKNSLMLWGETRGVGKTGALAPIVLKWLDQGRSALWLDFRLFIDLVKESYRNPNVASAGEMIGMARRADILLIDDLGDPGRESAETDHTREVMTNIIRHRHGQEMPTLFTTNQNPKGLAVQFSEELYHRVAEMALLIEMGGRVLRDLG